MELPLVSFRWTGRFLDAGEEIESNSTLRFRRLDEIRASLEQASFDVTDVRDARDRPTREFVILARRSSG